MLDPETSARGTGVVAKKMVGSHYLSSRQDIDAGRRHMTKKIVASLTERLIRSVGHDTRLYVTGDVHGRLDLLQPLGEAISEDAKASSQSECIEIFLGDYVDRGASSKGVIDWLISEPDHDGCRICLKGNHEDRLYRFWQGADVFEGLCRYGGIETFRSYGVHLSDHTAPEDAEPVREDFRRLLPEDHAEFLRSLPLMHKWNGLVFVHAGLKPGVALEDQKERDCLWIRDEFLESDYDFGAIVLHGHTPGPAIELRSNRINLDTHAYHSGRLSCLVISREGLQLIESRPDGVAKTAI